MAVHLFIAPAGAGKTEATIKWVRAASRERPLAPVWVCLPNAHQVWAFRRRLAAAGGALGVEVGTFFDLYKEALRAAGRVYAELDEPLQHRLLRAVVDEAAEQGHLQHYAALRDKPGFVRALHRMVEELKQARVQPAQLAAAVRGQGPRLEELAALYAGYQERLLAGRWMDAEGLGWLATSALAQRPRLLKGWALVAVDGFDQLNQTQVAFLAELARQVPELRITLTWSLGAKRLAHRRFAQALARLEERLGVEAEPLLGARVRLSEPLTRLEAALFEGPPTSVAAGTAVSFLEAASRAGEVRAVLRWAKERVLLDGMAPGEVAILARDLAPYAPFLAEVAREFGVPLRLAGGQPLSGNPAVAALLALLSLPRRDRNTASLPDGRFATRQLLEALRSPYFNWRDCLSGDGPLGLTAEDVGRLEEAAQAAQVLGGLAEWREALQLRAQAAPPAEEGDEGTVPGSDGSELAARFDRLVERLTPPERATVASYTAFVEGLIGDDPGLLANPEDQDPTSLRVPERIRNGPPDLVERDVAALHALKRALRSLVWAEEALGQSGEIPYERFLDELEGIVAAAEYEPAPEGGEAVWAAAVHDARGLSFRAVALLGLAEGEFPKPPPEDPLLRDTDREWLVAQGLRLELPPAGSEFTLFYEAVTRARERLLVSRPYLADDGQPWEPSPFWDELLRLGSGAPLERVRTTEGLPLARAASWPEVLVALGQRLATREPAAAAEMAALEHEPRVALLWRGARHGARVLASRMAARPAGAFEGDCAPLAPALSARYPLSRPWSASRLESYLGCPFGFFLSTVLELPERPREGVGFDAAQLGTMAHEILREVYLRAASPSLADLLAALPAVADEVLGRAPRRLGFRPGPLWQQEKARIRREVENTLRGLAECSEGWQPVGLELRFGMGAGGALPQRVRSSSGGEFLLWGIIDRADRNGRGEVRLIDYKSGSTLITPADLLEGQRIQLALYAWAAQGTLGLGPVAGGFYWHLRPAKRSSLSLQGMEGGPAAAMALAAEHAWRAVGSVRQGAFPPEPKGHGCPAYCRGSEFCWRYEPK